MAEEKLLQEAIIIHIIAPKPRVTSPLAVQFPLEGGNYSPSLLCSCYHNIIPCEGRNLLTGTDGGIIY